MPSSGSRSLASQPLTSLTIKSLDVEAPTINSYQYFVTYRKNRSPCAQHGVKCPTVAPSVSLSLALLHYARFGPDIPQGASLWLVQRLPRTCNWRKAYRYKWINSTKLKFHIQLRSRNTTHNSCSKYIVFTYRKLFHVGTQKILRLERSFSV